MHTQTTAQPTPVPPPSRQLDDLLALDAPALARLYAGARVPELAKISGDLRGRMLALPALTGAPAALVRRFAGSRVFPWLGKSFMPAGERGAGVNRVVSDRLKVFRFTTFVGKSRAGDFDAVQLDYDHPGNPFFIRAIQDELRELEDGLYLGQAYLLWRGTPRLVLYFGLTSR